MREKWKTPAGTAAAAALICGFATHFYGLVNTMHNYDDIIVQPIGVGTGLTSGRWLLEIFGMVLRYLGLDFNLTWLNGVVFLLLLAVGAGMLCRVLAIRKRFAAVLMGMLFVVFPTAVSSLIFRYASILYGIGILLALGACLALRRKRYGMVLAGGVLCLSLGIYQAYLPLTIGVMVLSLLRRTLEGEEPKGLVVEGLKACGAILLGLLAYFVILKVLMRLTGTQMSTYQGVSGMGAVSLRRMPQLIGRAFFECLTFVGQNRWNLADSKLIRLAYRVLAVLSLLMTGLLLSKGGKRTPLFWLLTVFLMLVFPVAVNFIVIMSPDSYIYTLMQYAFVLIGCVPLVLLDCLSLENQNVLKRGVCLFAGLLVCGYIYSANISYSANYYFTRQAENYLNSLMTQVRMTEGFTPEKEWAFIGNISDPMLGGVWSGVTGDGGLCNPNGLVNAYSRASWFDAYMGCYVSEADSTVTAALAQTEEVKAMPCWPSQGSIRVIGDTVVIKCQNIA